MKFSKKIRKIRAVLILTQEEFAKRIGFSFVSVNRWENGKIEPSIKAKRKIQKLCDKYGIK
jgi:DNA-binding XRE family transcriptional regulator